MKRTKDSRKSELRQNERMMREMLAWEKKALPPSLLKPERERDATIRSMVRTAFQAGWKSRDLKEHEPVVPSRFDGCPDCPSPVKCDAH